MKFLIVITILVGISFSCKKENLKKFDRVHYPAETQTFDVNGNGTADFAYNFSQVSSKDIPVSESIIIGSFIELRSTLIVPHLGGETFKLSQGDTIKRPSGFMDLVYYNRKIVSRNWDGDRWDELWTVNAVVDKTYYLGYLLDDNSEDDLGWVRFDINKEDATVIILESKHTSGDFIVIE
ncbi:MAG: hypothetical protein GQ574_27580 [Crocinitomix sp.]|nr:hypothetical protein [Crocinitomix sp.]